MISAVVPTFNAAKSLPSCLAALGGHDGLVAEIIVSDGGSGDATADIARQSGAVVVAGEKGRGSQLRRGAARACFPWLLFLHADTVLDRSWAQEVRPHLQREDCAATFSLAFAGASRRAALIAAGANFRARHLKLPYGDQGLLISRRLYDEIGGYRALPLFEDVEIIDRLIETRGRRALTMLPARAVTSAARYEQAGYAVRVLKNWASLALYRCGAPPERIVRFYET